MITQVPGGFLASMYPANKIFGLAIALSALFNMAIPGAMGLGPAAVVMLKVAQGFVEVSILQLFSNCLQITMEILQNKQLINNLNLIIKFIHREPKTAKASTTPCYLVNLDYSIVA